MKEEGGEGVTVENTTLTPHHLHQSAKDLAHHRVPSYQNVRVIHQQVAKKLSPAVGKILAFPVVRLEMLHQRISFIFMPVSGTQGLQTQGEGFSGSVLWGRDVKIWGKRKYAGYGCSAQC